MKSLNLFLFLICFSNLYGGEMPLIDNQPTIKFSENKPGKNTELVSNIIFDDGVNIYVELKKNSVQLGFASGSDVPAIVKLSSDLTLINRLDIKLEKHFPEYIGCYALNGKLFYVTTKFESKEKQYVIKAFILNDDLTLNGSAKILWTLSGTEFKNAELALRFSPDKMRLAILVTTKQSDKDAKKFYVKSFDKDLNADFAKDILLTNTVENVNLKEFCVANNGEVNILSTMNSLDVEKFKDKEYRIFVININKEKFSLNRIEIDAKIIMDHSITTNDKSDIQLMIQYSNEYYNCVNGFYYFKLDADSKEILNRIKYSFEESFANKVNKMQPENYEGKGAVYIYFKCNYFSNDNFGNVWIVFENNSSISTEEVGTIYHSNGIIPILIKGDNVKQVKFIPKIQSSRQMYQSYSPVLNNGSLYLLYNDDESNASFDIESSDKSPEKFKNGNKAHLMMVQMDGIGNLKKTDLGNKDNFDTVLDINKTAQFFPERVVLVGSEVLYGGSLKTRLGFLKFK